jgi:hypothetical protein
MHSSIDLLIFILARRQHMHGLASCECRHIRAAQLNLTIIGLCCGNCERETEEFKYSCRGR